MLLDCCNGKRRAYLDADLNLIDVRDVAEGLIRAVDRGTPGRRYLLGGENWSIRRVFSWVARQTGQPEPRWRVPYPLALAAAYVSEFVAAVGTGQIPAATVTGVKLTRRTMHFDASRSLAELELRPRPVEEALRDAIEWFRAVGWISSRRLSEPRP
jgi:dihydroflavonol-4-reductase